jgi:probable rRNA maturation factor
MSIVVSLDVSPKRRDLKASELEEFAQRALRAMKLKHGGFGILITGSGQLQQLNLRFRGKNQPTDVLSFPAAAFNQKGDFPFVHTGDIAISADIAADNAQRYGHSLSDEIEILMLHGMLHLSGLDHESDDGEMAKRELQLRQKLGLPSGLIQRAKSRPQQGSNPRARRKNAKTAPKRRNSIK